MPSTPSALPAAHQSTLARVCMSRAVGPVMLASACGVSDALGYRWWAGARVAERHRGTLASLVGASGADEVYAGFAPAVGRGRRTADSVKLIRRCARELRGLGRYALASSLDAVARGET